MTINISTGLKNEVLAGNLNVKKKLVSNGISLGDGDGTGGLDTINAASGLDTFPKHSFLKVLTDEGDPNWNKMVKVLSSSATKLEVPAGSFTDLAAGDNVILLWFDVAGAIKNIFQNGVLRLFNENRSSSADAVEPGAPICEITLNGNPFTAGNPLNGLNFGDVENSVLRRAIDPETSASEIHRGTPTSAVTANSARLYTNKMITGQSIVACRIDYTVSGPSGGGDLTISPSNILDPEIPVDITSTSFKLDSKAFV